MTQLTSDIEVRSALYELQRYLSDELAPMMAVEAVDLLLNAPPAAAASVIQSWVSSQYGRPGVNASVSDYLFHSLKKLHVLSELELIARDPMTTYVEELGRILLEFCPAEDRETLWENVGKLGAVEGAATSPVEIIHRQIRAMEPAARSGEDAAWRATGRGGISGASARNMALLVDRLARDSRAETGPSHDDGAGRAELLTRILATAAIQSATETELERHLRPLSKMGVDAEMGQVFRALGRSLPQWSLGPDVVTAPAGIARSDRTVDAMRRMITMAGDEREGTRRFGQMVDAAIEQFNAGSLVQAATMFDLAEQVVTEQKLTPDLVTTIRRQGRDLLAPEQLRKFAEKQETHALLRAVLNFFPGLTVDGLLGDLEDEQRRDRRKLMLALLEAHGAPTRHAALERLHARANGEQDPHGYFRRNLVFLLRRIPRPTGSPVDEELNVLAQTSKLTDPLVLVREAISTLGQINHEGAERILTSRLTSLEQMVAGGDPGVYELQDLNQLLDRTVAALANIGSPTAFRTIVDHALKRRKSLGDTVSRLEALNGHDISEDKELVARLVETLRADLPVKVLGIVVKHEHKMMGSLIRALSGTPAPAVREVMEEIVQRFPGRDFAAAAAKVLATLGATSRPADQAAEMLSGEVELFGLPNLFQVVGDSRLTGLLVLADRAGVQIGSVSFMNGKIKDCEAGALKGKSAFYQLFEKPVRGTFTFQAQREAPKDGTSDASHLEVLPMVVEALRRHDEFREAKILVPGNVQLAATRTPPSPPVTDEEPGFVEAIWMKATAGVTPAKLEDALGVDSFRVRHLLAHWLEEGALRIR